MKSMKVLVIIYLLGAIFSGTAHAQTFYLINQVGSDSDGSEFTLVSNGLSWGSYSIGYTEDPSSPTGEMPFDGSNPGDSWSSWNIYVNNSDGDSTYCGNVTYQYKCKNNNCSSNSGEMYVKTAYNYVSNLCECSGFKSVSTYSSGAGTPGTVTVSCSGGVVFGGDS